MTQEASRLTFATEDIDEAHHVLGRLYGEHGFRLRRPAHNFQFRQEAVLAGPMMIGHLNLHLDVDLRVEPLQDFLFVALVEGRLQTRTGRDELRAVRGSVFVNKIGLPLANTSQYSDVHTLTLDRGLVAEAGAASGGIDPADFRFEALAPVSPAMGRHWRNTMAYVQRVYSGPAEVLGNPLVHRSCAELAAAAAVAAFPNTAMAAPYQRGPGDIPPAAVRRAVTFIEDHAGAPITTAKIAAAARVGPRALQAAFRRHLDTTPTAYLRRVRLDRAHRDLMAADATNGDTVTLVAHRWGWASVSRFAAEYRAAYGRPPSQTLRT